MKLQGANGPKVNFISSNEKMPKTHAKNNDCVRSRKRNFKRRPNGNQPQPKAYSNQRKNQSHHPKQDPKMAVILIIAIMHVLYVVSMDI